MISLDGVDIVLGAFRLAADLRIARGKLVAVIGPSGAGKSTLLAAIGGFLDPARGRVEIGGRDVTRARPSERPVTTLFQDNNLFTHLSASQNVGLGLRPDLRLKAADVSRIAKALARVGLEGYGDRRASDLSGGQQSRVALARVLVQDRPVLLLDEPFAALGPALRREMLDLVRDLTRDMDLTVLMVSHSPEDARRIADAVILVADGQAAPPRPTGEMFDNPPEALARYIGEDG